MAVLSGTAGSVVYGGTAGTAIEGMKSWTLDVAVGELDASSFGSTWKLVEGGIKEWSGSAEGNTDDGTAMQQSAWTSLTTGAKVVMLFGLGAADTYYGTALITGQSVNSSFDGLASTSYTFKGHGPLTKV